MKIRQFTWDDLPAIANLMTRHAAAYGRVQEVKAEQLEKAWRSPYNHPERDAFVAEDADGQLLGYSIADILSDEHFANGVYQVLPNHIEAGRLLVEAATQHFIRFSANDKTSSLTMEWHISEEDSEAIAMFEADGFEEVRQFFTMRISLETPITAMPLAQEFRLVPFSANLLEEVYATKVEIFKDHWGEGIDDISEWQADSQNPKFDPSLWFLAYKDNDLAAMLLSQPSSETSAWVGIVGVKRAYRKLGLAQNLLKQCFLEYQKRGYKTVYLGVDSQNPSKAVALYERVGMSVYQKIRYYRKSY